MRGALAIVTALLLAHVSVANAEEPAFSPLALVGTWTSSDTKPNVGVFTTTMMLTQNMKFSGSMTLEGKPFMDYSGTWELDGAKLTWHYERSSRPLPEAAKMDVDDIVRVDPDQLVLVSRLTGLQHVLTRKRQP
jgi:hypothetical protein